MTKHEQFVMLVQTGALEWIIENWFNQLQNKEAKWPGWDVAMHIVGDAMRVTDEELPELSGLTTAALGFINYRVDVYASALRDVQKTPEPKLLCPWLRTKF